MSRLVIIGSSNMDLTVKVKQIPLRGETVMAGDIVSAYGGKGANQAVAAKRFGSEAIFIWISGSETATGTLMSHRLWPVHSDIGALQLLFQPIKVTSTFK